MATTADAPQRPLATRSKRQAKRTLLNLGLEVSPDRSGASDDSISSLAGARIRSRRHGGDALVPESLEGKGPSLAPVPARRSLKRQQPEGCIQAGAGEARLAKRTMMIAVSDCRAGPSDQDACHCGIEAPAQCLELSPRDAELASLLSLSVGPTFQESEDDLRLFWDIAGAEPAPRGLPLAHQPSSPCGCSTSPCGGPQPQPSHCNVGVSPPVYHGEGPLLEGLTRRMALELSETRAQLAASLQLALCLSRQLDQAKDALAQQRALRQRGKMGSGRLCAQAMPCESQGSADVASDVDGADSASCAESAADSHDTERYAEMLMEQEAKLCHVCMVAEAGTVVLPCRHLVLCRDCTPAVAKCPKCCSDMHGVLHLSE